ncbi:hypothetical protein M426DRAFT_78967 [Hypoxylon sp. CI-4A]|nr:hypothetical protein M426DRAFT_78967 [Hypoxylon sp. CI-4A]
MSEYWKSTPKYWCKHCSIYVRDTKFERQNHEATGKHQGALKRFLRDLHRNHEQDLREKERAKREIERLNGVVASISTSSDRATSSKTTSETKPSASSRSQPDDAPRQKQWEQLAEMGIDVPTELRGEMAMVGEWTVTNTRVVNDAPKTEDGEPGNVEAIASGVRKRSKRETEDDEEEDAIKGLFKKPKRWGRDTKQAPEDDVELDALLNGSLTKPVKPETQPESQVVKKEESDLPAVKKEDSSSNIKKEMDEGQDLSHIRSAADDKDAPGVPVKEEEKPDNETPAVVFKKRKPKNIRQR